MGRVTGTFWRSRPTPWASAREQPMRQIRSVVVVVTTGAVYVTVRQFFFRSRADFEDFDVEVQRLAGERVVAIEHRAGVRQFHDRE